MHKREKAHKMRTAKKPSAAFKKRGIALLLIFTGVLSMMYGIHREEHITVGKKASLICLECIGIG